MSYLLDTNVVSELRRSKRRADCAVRRWVSGRSPSDLHLSVVTVLEVELGITQGLADGMRPLRSSNPGATSRADLLRQKTLRVGMWWRSDSTTDAAGHVGWARQLVLIEN